jgi:hypothetical protein
MWSKWMKVETENSQALNRLRVSAMATQKDSTA